MKSVYSFRAQNSVIYGLSVFGKTGLLKHTGYSDTLTIYDNENVYGDCDFGERYSRTSIARPPMAR